MSLFHINFFSTALQKQSAMYVILPEAGPPYRVVYLLHGLSDDYTIWLRRTSIERYAEQEGLMVVMPDGGRSFYCDMADGTARYEQHMIEIVRFIDRTFRTVKRPDGRGIGGLSMGGYGAMKLSLKYPTLFGSIASHSGALDMASFTDERLEPEYRAIYGKRVHAREDCFALAARARRRPAIYFNCGLDDFLIEHNRRFHKHLTQLGISHEYYEFPGDHNWEYWDEHVQQALRFHQRCFGMETNAETIAP